MLRTLFLILLLLASNASASSLNGRVYVFSELLDTVADQSRTGAGPLLSDVAVSSLGPLAYGTGSLSAQYTANFGLLRARASSVLASPLDLPLFVSTGGGATAEVSFEDVLTIHAPGLAGTSGTLRIALEAHGAGSAIAAGVNGRLESSGYASWEARVIIATDVLQTDFRVGECGVAPSSGGGCSVPSPPGPWTTIAFDFTYGEPLSLELRLLATAGGAAVADGSSSAEMDLFNTLAWRGFSEVLDSNGALVSAYTVTSDSGTDWSKSVPEPASALWLALAAALLATARSR